jgi:hypothetical protein
LLKGQSRPSSESGHRLSSSPASQPFACPTLDPSTDLSTPPMPVESVCRPSRVRPPLGVLVESILQERRDPSVSNQTPEKAKYPCGAIFRQGRRRRAGMLLFVRCKRQSGSAPTPSHSCKRGTARAENAAYHRLNEIVAGLAADPASPTVRHAHAVGSNGASPSAWNVVVHGVPVHVPPNAVVCLGRGTGVRGTR